MMVEACEVRPKEARSESIRRRRSFRGSELHGVGTCAKSLGGKSYYLVLARRDEKSRVSLTVRDPMRASSCSTKQVICRKADWETSVPLMRTLAWTSLALVGRRARTLRRVVLPQPDGPINAQISPEKMN